MPNAAQAAVVALVHQYEQRLLPMTPLEKIVRRINRYGDVNHPETPRPLLSLEDFFEGNDDYGSIGYNFYPDQPPPTEFYALFLNIRQRSDVADVLVEVSQHEVPEEWPSADTVWIITTASPAEIRAWLGERFKPDEIYDGWTEYRRREDYSTPKGMKPIGIYGGTKRARDG
jgi:hypothetical protein